MNSKIQKLLESVKKDLNIKETNDIIEEMMENRIGAISEVSKVSGEYATFTSKLIAKEKLIRKKAGNSKEILDLLEEYQDLKYQRDYITDRLYYKAGIYDALTFTIASAETKDLM